MSKIKARHVFTSESVSEGHPDKVCDQISDAILDACLAQDPCSRVACETLATTDLVVMSGEITTRATVHWENVAREVIRTIGYNDPGIGFSADSCKVLLCLHPQSPDISQGVTADTAKAKEQGAGDQGMMFGYATDETPERMPAPILYAHGLVRRFAELRHSDPKTYWYLRPDAKSQVSVLYDGGRPVKVTTVVLSHQHSPEVDEATLRTLVADVVHEVIPGHLLDDEVRYYVNPTGRFVVGGPQGDTGLTGRKIIVDTYGGVGCHGGGAFSGKDPSKVDRSAAYMCRYIASNIVAAGLARKCEVQVAYAIGVAKPLSVNVDTFGTGSVPEARLQALLEAGEVIDLRPAAIIAALGLQTPQQAGWCYRETAAYGHFGRSQFPWERTDRADALRSALGA
jgi:S-adenosylmethionine synthetase